MKPKLALSGQLSQIGRWALVLLGLVWLACFERLLGVPVVTLALATVWGGGTRNRNELWMGVSVVLLSLVIAALYQVSVTGVVIVTLVQLVWFHQARLMISSFTIRWWIVGWLGAIGTVLLLQKMTTLGVWIYPVVVTTLMVVGLKLLSWWQRTRYQLQTVKLKY